jgi:hypothetical protein
MTGRQVLIRNSIFSWGHLSGMEVEFKGEDGGKGVRSGNERPSLWYHGRRGRMRCPCLRDTHSTGRHFRHSGRRIWDLPAPIYQILGLTSPLHTPGREAYALPTADRVELARRHTNLAWRRVCDRSDQRGHVRFLAAAAYWARRTTTISWAQCGQRTQAKPSRRSPHLR